MNAPHRVIAPFKIAVALGLEEFQISDDEAAAAIVALKAELATARSIEQQARADAQQLLADAAAWRKGVVDAEIDAALRAGKITPASVDYHRAACADAEGLERFRAFVRGAPAIGGDA